MKVTISKDYRRTAPLTEEVSFVNLTDLSVDSLTQSFSFLEDYKDSLFNGDISDIICETNNELYRWWRLCIWRPLDNYVYNTEEFECKGKNITLYIHGASVCDHITESLIHYDNIENKFYYYFEGIRDGKNIWILQGESKNLVGALAYCLHSCGMIKKARNKEFNPRKGLKMKEYNKFQKCLWESYSTKMKSAEGYKNVSPEDIMIESIYSALRNTFTEDKIEELTDMLGGDE